MLGNCLIAGVNQAFACTNSTVQAEHLTVDWCDILAPPDSVSFSAAIQNSIFARVTSLGRAATSFSGNNNGSDGSSPTIGTAPLVDSVWPFADPTSLATVQGWYYLRDGSPFLSVGSTTINSTLAADFAQRTSFVPELLTQDLVSSQTIAPTVPRETGIPANPPSLGWHYPVVDYVLNGATVNNCTLNIDQGTVVALTSPYGVGYTYEWGLRLNPGGRLNVWGVPTNRVVFARLEGVQESPYYGYQQDGGPMFTFKGVFVGSGSGTMVTPLPEAHFHFADFPTLAGNATHFGSLLSDTTFDCVSALDLHSCLLQGGVFTYEVGGPQGRVLGITNTIFERSVVILGDKQNDTHGNYIMPRR